MGNREGYAYHGSGLYALARMLKPSTDRRTNSRPFVGLEHVENVSPVNIP